MDCSTCAVTQTPRPATQRVTFWRSLFTSETREVRTLCDEHAALTRLSYHVVTTEDLDVAQHDVARATYRTAMDLVIEDPQAWPRYSQGQRRVILNARLQRLHGEARYADHITAILTIARYEGISLDEKE